MALFESKEAKAVRRQVTIRQGKRKVKDYVGKCQSMAFRYEEMAKRAVALGDSAKCDQYLCRRVQYRQQAEKWSRFALQMEDIGLRSNMAQAMGAVMGSMAALTSEITTGVSVKGMTQTISDLNLAGRPFGDSRELPEPMQWRA